MKNNTIIFEMVDDELKINKPSDGHKPENDDEAKQSIINDIATTTEGLMTLIKIANDSGYMDSDKSANQIIKYMNENFLNNK